MTYLGKSPEKKSILLNSHTGMIYLTKTLIDLSQNIKIFYYFIIIIVDVVPVDQVFLKFYNLKLEIVLLILLSYLDF
jgi:hypothetical protein